MSLDPDVRIGPLPTAVYLGPDYQFAAVTAGDLSDLITEIEAAFARADRQHFSILMTRLRDALELLA